MHLASGEELAREVHDAPGGHRTPMTDSQFEVKLAGPVEPLTTATWCVARSTRCWHADHVPSVPTLTEAPVVDRPPTGRRFP